MTIFEITADLQALSDLIDESTLDENGEPRELTAEQKETLVKYINEIEGNFKAKADNILRFRQELVRSAEACKQEEERLYKLRVTRENKAKLLMNLLQFAMERVQMEKLETDHFKLWIQKNNPSVMISNEEKLPCDLFRVIPEKRSPDKAAILAKLEDGEDVPGAYMVQTKGLRVR